MKTIEELANYYATDKRMSDHGFTEFYEKHFEARRDQRLNICEIGILNHPDKINRPFEGASLLMWRDYFYNSGIIGIDINDHSSLNGDKIRTYVADQGNRTQLQDLFQDKQVDIIIEDGSHFMHHQQISLGVLFRNLKPGGIFVIEDLHTSHLDMLPSFRRNIKDTITLNMLQDYNKTGSIKSTCMTKEEIDYLNDNISNCVIEVANMSEIAFIYKKNNL
jgi:ubiquinone/menaquinone biosynthesis C-methylase UbiE